jgi:hypothetical protein
VPWCISNGEEWLFGLLSQDSSDPIKTVRSYRLPILTLEGSRKKDLELVFKMLIIWVSTVKLLAKSVTYFTMTQTAIPDRSIKSLFFTPATGVV